MTQLTEIDWFTGGWNLTLRIGWIQACAIYLRKIVIICAVASRASAIWDLAIFTYVPAAGINKARRATFDWNAAH